jgi:hypothetical protein
MHIDAPGSSGTQTVSAAHPPAPSFPSQARSPVPNVGVGITFVIAGGAQTTSSRAAVAMKRFPTSPAGTTVYSRGLMANDRLPDTVHVAAAHTSTAHDAVPTTQSQSQVAARASKSTK